MENKTVNIVYESICRFREEETCETNCLMEKHKLMRTEDYQSIGNQVTTEDDGGNDMLTNSKIL